MLRRVERDASGCAPAISSYRHGACTSFAEALIRAPSQSGRRPAQDAES